MFLSIIFVSSEGFRDDSLCGFSLRWENLPALGSSDEASMEDLNIIILMVH